MNLAAAITRLLDGELEWPYRVHARLTGACPRCYHRFGNHFRTCDRRINRKPRRPWASRT